MKIKIGNYKLATVVVPALASFLMVTGAFLISLDTGIKLISIAAMIFSGIWLVFSSEE